MSRVILALCLVMAPLVAQAQTAPTRSEIRAQAQASMIVAGSFDIEADGTISSHALDRQDALPGYVVDAVDRTVRQWRFEPVKVDGVAVRARAQMRLRLLAKWGDDGAVGISVSSANFAYPDREDTSSLYATRMVPPRYPAHAIDNFVSGDAYVVVKISREGVVTEAIVEQVNLRALANGRTSDRLRKEFSRASLEAARRWTFRTPTTGEDADAPFWSARVPVSFVMDGMADPDGYGQWLAYIPGPRQTVPWLSEQEAGTNDAVAAGTFEQIGGGPQLLTPLQPES